MNFLPALLSALFVGCIITPYDYFIILVMHSLAVLTCIESQALYRASSDTDRSIQ